ncbi:lipoprotein [uncultured Microbulbifer sp.]|uniref:LPS translocon maturation chaperone LptM n=1 Tax=uncultured Microbulbifer sp. TaxID=348147 RepID=UPI00262647ED|nr:lipoprotein [uncultured Microbulbifer sp.]
MRNPTTSLAWSAALSIALTGALAGCGQKGPLYLPQDPAAPAPSSSSSAPRTPTAPQPGATTEPHSNSDEKNSSQQHTEAEAVSK